jgi:transposase
VFNWRKMALAASPTTTEVSGTAARPPTVSEIAMEACGGAHYWVIELIALGHKVRLIPPQYVKPYVKRPTSNVAKMIVMTRVRSARRQGGRE